jgi:hypothetical protein
MYHLRKRASGRVQGGRWTATTRDGEETFELVIFSSCKVEERPPYLGGMRAGVRAAIWKRLDRRSVKILIGGKV